MSIVFDLGGFVGCLVVGYICDKYARYQRTTVAGA